MDQEWLQAGLAQRMVEAKWRTRGVVEPGTMSVQKA